MILKQNNLVLIRNQLIVGKATEKKKEKKRKKKKERERTTPQSSSNKNNMHSSLQIHMRFNNY